MAVNVGNPHLVFFVADAREVPLDELGPRIEHDPAFPERINVNVATYRRRPARNCAPGSAAPARRWPAAPAPARPRSPRSPRSARNRRSKVDMTGGSADHQLGARRADPHARRRDPRVRGRARPGGAAMSVETITLGCRLNFAESETIARSRAGRRGLDHRQQLRGDQRSGAPDPPGDPPRAPAAARARRSSSPAARPSSSRRPSRRCRRSRASSETRASSTPSRQMTS